MTQVNKGGRPKGSISTKKGIELLKRSGYRLTRAWLDAVYRLDRAAQERPESLQLQRQVIDSIAPVFKHLYPTLQAVSPAMMDADGNFLAPGEILRLIEIAKEAQLLCEPTIKEVSDVQGPAETEGSDKESGTEA